MRAKSRVVAQGFTQTFGVDYDETYVPVSRLASLWTICMIAALNDWLIHQMDVYNAYVHADLEEPIYIYATASRIYSTKQPTCTQAEKLCTDSNNLDKHGTSVYLLL